MVTFQGMELYLSITLKTVKITGPRRLENGVVIPGKLTAFNKSAAVGQKLKERGTLQAHADRNNRNGRETILRY